jgi:sugar phosphate isomerase/epimerase
LGFGHWSFEVRVALAFAVSSRVKPLDPEQLGQVARSLAVQGIEWRLDALRVPVAAKAREAFFARIGATGLAARYHAPYTDLEFAHKNPTVARQSLAALRSYLELLPAGGQTVFTVHVGSKGIPVEELSWDHAVGNLRSLVQVGASRGITVAVETLATGWTADPWAIGELCGRSGARITFDLGHCLASEAVTSKGKKVTEVIDGLARFIVQGHIYGAELEDGRHVPWQDLEQVKPALRHLAQLPDFWWILDVDDAAAAARMKEQIASGAFV